MDYFTDKEIKEYERRIREAKDKYVLEVSDVKINGSSHVLSIIEEYLREFYKRDTESVFGKFAYWDDIKDS